MYAIDPLCDRPAEPEQKRSRAIPAAPVTPRRAFGRAGGLWPGWLELDRWEGRAEAAFGPELAGLLVALWSAHRLGATAQGHDLLEDMLEGDDEPVDPVLEDILDMSFALGAAWGSAQVAAAATMPAIHLVEPAEVTIEGGTT